MIPNLLKERPALFTLIFLIILLPAISFANADKIFKENNKAVVVVVAYNEKGEPISQGSGFIVRADGAIVTNYHIISNAVDIKVKVGDKVLDVEGLIHTDKENDLVILKIKGEKLPIVKIGDIEKANIGEKVYVISSPEGLENTISDGILSGIREIEGTNKKILQITAPVSKGSSGGPVFNKNGEVIGIATFLIEEAQNLNFAMPVNLIKNKIDSKKITALKDSTIEDYKKNSGVLVCSWLLPF
jgi:S1-C subfamily serine protease